jgi:hypothetical protein
VQDAPARNSEKTGSDEELEALLRRELMEIASFNGLDEQSVQRLAQV